MAIYDIICTPGAKLEAAAKLRQQLDSADREALAAASGTAAHDRDVAAAEAARALKAAGASGRQVRPRHDASRGALRAHPGRAPVRPRPGPSWRSSPRPLRSTRPTPWTPSCWTHTCSTSPISHNTASPRTYGQRHIWQPRRHTEQRLGCRMYLCSHVLGEAVYVLGEAVLYEVGEVGQVRVQECGVHGAGLI